MCVCDCRYSERTQLLDSSGVRGKKLVNCLRWILKIEPTAIGRTRSTKPYLQSILPPDIQFQRFVCKNLFIKLSFVYRVR